jgi:hypothetical protein
LTSLTLRERRGSLLRVRPFWNDSRRKLSKQTSLATITTWGMFMLRLDDSSKAPERPVILRQQRPLATMIKLAKYLTVPTFELIWLMRF